MATQKVVEGSSGVTASQLKDLFQQIEDGSIDGAYLQAVLGHRVSAGTKPAQNLLEHLATVAVPGAERFVASEHLMVDTSRKAKVRIAFLWDNFRDHFLTKVEENVPAGDLKLHKLLKSSVDKPIIKELGKTHETYLADLWAMLEKQPNGEEGDLLVNGYANIFYIRDKDGTLWAVRVSWYSDDDGWYLDAFSVESPGEWHGGRQVVSR